MSRRVRRTNSLVNSQAGVSNSGMTAKRKKTNRSKTTGGFVYLLTNAAMPGLVKIGMTRRHPLERVRELNSTTSLPFPFRIVAAVETQNAVALEKSIHQALSGKRVNDRREFFRVSIPEAEGVMSAAAHRKRATPVRSFKSKPRRSRAKSRRRRRPKGRSFESLFAVAFVASSILLIEHLNPGTFFMVRNLMVRISALFG
ncbi:GIY-YIG nuclease family protein [Roseibium sp. RKSG952]|uniref:GIY-YIG nuclease family protein n=1 Tax=Roseibium sp. RKSG952 TaxID=2529384 RepID=UPI0034CFA6AD